MTFTPTVASSVWAFVWRVENKKGAENNQKVNI